MVQEQYSNAERRRLAQDQQREMDWKRWGPYLADRQWGTVREDYSADGNNWTYFPHDQAASRVYRWGEDGLLGFTDRECLLCFGLAMWNGKDPILKERPFGLAPQESNHGEDVKDYYFNVDSTPTHSYMKGLYKYPQAEFPYAELVRRNQQLTRDDPEFELIDTGVFAESRYFDVFAEYAKNTPDDLCIRLSIANRGPETATLHLLPTLWFRNTWAFGAAYENWPRPTIRRHGEAGMRAEHARLGNFVLVAGVAPGGQQPGLLFTENQTNLQRIFEAPNHSPHVKDAFHDYVVRGRTDAVNPEQVGTKAAFHYRLDVPPGQTVVLRLRLFAEDQAPADPLGANWQEVFDRRFSETNQFYDELIPHDLPADEREIIRQACAGLLMGKQFYYYVVKDWLDGDPKQPPPPPQRRIGRNHEWQHFFSRDVISVPDKWESPLLSSCDMAMQLPPLARLDPHFAKQQLLLLGQERMMNMDGQIPSSEHDFAGVNPPVHAWSCWQTYLHDATGSRSDRDFLKRSFTQMLQYFTWWANRRDSDGKPVFAGGFVGLDDPGLLPDKTDLPGIARMEQADAAPWAAFFCLGMMRMAVELAREEPLYESQAARFFQYFLSIADAANCVGGMGLWDEEDGFYYTAARIDGEQKRIRVRSIAGLIPLLATTVLDDETLGACPQLQGRFNWLLTYRCDLASQVITMPETQDGPRRILLAMVSQDRLRRVLRYLLDETEFLSFYGIRSLSRFHKEHPYTLRVGDREHVVEYEPGMSRTGPAGANSNWRGPIWMPINYLLVEALDRYHQFYGDTFRMECPTGSGVMMNLQQISREIKARLCRIFLPEQDGRRPWQGPVDLFARDPYWNYLTLFHEYFHGDTGMGLGASHQTGWTALIVPLLEQTGRAAAESVRRGAFVETARPEPITRP